MVAFVMFSGSVRRTIDGSANNRTVLFVAMLRVIIPFSIVALAMYVMFRVVGLGDTIYRVLFS